MPRLLARAARRLVVPFVPRRARLRVLSRIARFGGEWEPELVDIERMLPERRRVAIDVGANQGFYSLRLSSFFERVYSFEINPEIVADLTAARIKNVTVVPEGLSRAAAGPVTLYIPVLASGLALHGWASLQPGNCPDAVDHEHRQVVISTLDSFRIDDVSYMKIDVEGHECEMLEGAKQTMTRCRPVVLIEIKLQNLDRIRTYFAELGYRELALRDIVQAEPTPENHLFVPGPSTSVKSRGASPPLA